MRNKILFAILLATSVQANAKETAADNYKAYCVQCHGMAGNGKGVNIRDMSVLPRDHTDAKAMSGRSDEALHNVIEEGGTAISKSILMPPWEGAMTDEEINDMVQYLRTLCKCKFGN
jgi:cytochrome c oxidase cbb3-type subunit 3